MKNEFGTDDARKIGEQIGVDFTKFDLEEFRKGLAIELEHGSHDPETNVTNSDPLLTGKIAWTYKINVPNTSEIKGSWGTIKVSGSINGYVIKSHNLMPNKGEDMYMSINNDIRKHAKAVDGDLLDVTLYLDY